MQASANHRVIFYTTHSYESKKGQLGVELDI